MVFVNSKIKNFEITVLQGHGNAGTTCGPSPPVPSVCRFPAPPSTGQTARCCAYAPGHISLFDVPASGTAIFFVLCSFLQFRTDGSLSQSPLPPRDSAAENEFKKHSPLLNLPFNRGECPFAIILLRVPDGHESHQSSIRSHADGQKACIHAGLRPSERHSHSRLTGPS